MISVNRFVGQADGQDLIEYALLIAFIALVAATAVGALGQAVFDVLYSRLAVDLFGGG